MSLSLSIAFPSLFLSLSLFLPLLLSLHKINTYLIYQPPLHLTVVHVSMHVLHMLYAQITTSAHSTARNMSASLIAM